jgi:hypothetical protein
MSTKTPGEKNENKVSQTRKPASSSVESGISVVLQVNLMLVMLPLL